MRLGATEHPRIGGGIPLFVASAAEGFGPPWQDWYRLPGKIRWYWHCGGREPYETAKRRRFLGHISRMKTFPVCAVTLLSTALAPASALADDWYASSDGNGNGTSADSPASVSSAVNSAQPGDTVYIRGGTYTGWGGSIHPARSGTADAWITFAAYPGELPIFEGSGVGSGTYEYIRYVGLASRNGSSGGFGNGWTDGNCSTMSNSHLQYINVIADGNGINGIAHYCATGLHVKQSIVAHNGNLDPSWSSGVNLFAVQGEPGDNVVEQTISFENIDISSHHSDGSGFIMDQNSTGATFINNIGFHNGGSCIRLTNSPNAQIINNTCVHNGLDPTAQYHDEIFFSDTSKTHQGALLRNNLCIPTDGQRGLTMGDGVTAENNEFSGTSAMVVSTTGDLDFHLVDGASPIDAGASGAPSPADDIGFDWRCIKQQSGQAVSWWQHAIDYDYIASIGGIAACFQVAARSGTPDQGAHEFGTAGAPSVGGAPGNGGSPGEGGVPGDGGAPENGGTPGDGGVPENGGTPGNGGTSLGEGGLLPGNGGTSLGEGGSLPGNGGTPSNGGAALGNGGTLASGGTPLGTGGAVGRGGAVGNGGSPGTGGSAPPGSGGAVGNGGASVATAGVDEAAGTATAGTGPVTNSAKDLSGDESGCGCRMTHRSPVSTGLLAILGVLVLARRRRHPRVLF